MRREEAFGKVPEYVFETQTSFQRCPQCRKIYWAGSHPERMRQQLERELGWEMGSEVMSENGKWGVTDEATDAVTAQYQAKRDPISVDLQPCI